MVQDPQQAGPPEDPQPRPRRRTTRRRTAADAAPPVDASIDATPAAAEEPQRAPVRRRGRRPSTAESAPGVSDPPAQEAPATSEEPQRAPQRRRGQGRQTAERAALGMPPPPDASRTEERTGSAGGTRRGRRGRRRDGDEVAPTKAFMHPSEKEFADLLDYYHINYLYEPRSFPLRWDGSRVVEMFTPDFYLPEYDQYFELTTMKQNLVTQKNRKLRHVREMYPEVNVQLLYRRDLMRLMGKYGFGPLAEVSVEGTERVLFDEATVQARVKELGAQVSRDYAGEELVLIGILRGVVVFMADLMRAINLPLQLEFMEITHYGEEREKSIDVIRDVMTELKGRHVLIVEDIVDTGLTLRYLLEHLQAKGPASLRVCTMLDKSVRRMADIPIDYVGFEVPDEFVIGYGLDYGGRYRNLPYVGVLQPVEPRAVPQR